MAITVAVTVARGQRSGLLAAAAHDCGVQPSLSLGACLHRELVLLTIARQLAKASC